LMDSTPLLHWLHPLAAHSSPQLCVSSLCHTHSLFSPQRKRQLQFLLEGRGRRAGLSPEELRDNGKLLGESLSRALFNYPSRDCSAESPEVSPVCFTKVLRHHRCLIKLNLSLNAISNISICLQTASKTLSSWRVCARCILVVLCVMLYIICPSQRSTAGC